MVLQSKMAVFITKNAPYYKLMQSKTPHKNKRKINKRLRMKLILSIKKTMEQQKIYCLRYKRTLRLNLYHGKTTVIRDKKKAVPESLPKLHYLMI